MKINILFCTFFLLMTGCTDDSDLCSLDQVKSEVSRDGKINAVVMIKDCGATTSAAYYIFLSAVDDYFDKENPVFLADRVEDLSITWIKNYELLITYSSARIFQFKNFYYSAKTGSRGKNVSIFEIDKDKEIDL